MNNSTPKSEFVTDTMGLILRIEQRKPGLTANSIFNLVESGNATVHIPTMVFAEILYSSEKRRIGFPFSAVAEYLKRFPDYREYPMSLAVVRSTAEITDIPELHDRLIAGTARLLDLDLITNDPVIQASTSVRTVW